MSGGLSGVRVMRLGLSWNAESDFFSERLWYLDGAHLTSKSLIPIRVLHFWYQWYFGFLSWSQHERNITALALA